MSHSDKLRVTLETLKEEERLARDTAQGATADMPEAELQLYWLRAVVLSAAAEAVRQILEERWEEETDDRTSTE